MAVTILAGSSAAATSRAIADLLTGESPPLMPVSGPEEQALRRELRAHPPAPLPAGTAVVMRTSGSTSGLGRSVLISLSSLRASALATQERLGGPGRWVCCLPTHHIAGFQTVFRSVLAGTEPVEAGRGTPSEIAAAARHVGADRAYVSLVPTQLFRLLDSPQVRAARTFAAILLGGAAAPAELVTRARNAGLNIVTTYGMTETCGGCVYDGRPIGETSITLGEGGRITIAGRVVATGYLGSTPFDGVCVTQDSGRWVNSKLEVLGRLDTAITTGGLTILPGVVERELEKLGGGECVVVGVPDAQWGEIAVAVTTHPVAHAKEHLRRELEAGYAPRKYLTPAHIGLEAMPRLPSGKVDRQRVQRLVREKL